MPAFSSLLDQFIMCICWKACGAQTEHVHTAGQLRSRVDDMCFGGNTGVTDVLFEQACWPARASSIHVGPWHILRTWGSPATISNPEANNESPRWTRCFVQHLRLQQGLAQLERGGALSMEQARASRTIMYLVLLDSCDAIEGWDGMRPNTLPRGEVPLVGQGSATNKQLEQACQRLRQQLRPDSAWHLQFSHVVASQESQNVRL